MLGATGMIVYGDPCYQRTARELLAGLQERLARAAGAGSTLPLDWLRLLLIEAGQLEQAVEDAAGVEPDWRSLTRDITAAAAAAFVAKWSAGSDRAVSASVNRLAQLVQQDCPPRDLSVTVKVPEGFAFYSLYPEQYCAASEGWSADHAGNASKQVLVIGVRSIGTTLSAAVAATLSQAGWNIRRITVRPIGNPFDRKVKLDPQEVRGAAHAIVVDEGPGASGSSMAAGARALADAGMDCRAISFFPGHGGEPGAKASEEVRRWWATTARYVVPLGQIRWNGLSLTEALAELTPGLLARSSPVEHVEDLSGGLWRRAAFSDVSQWPAAFPMFERTKYRFTTREGRMILWKFAGLTSPAGGGAGAAEAALDRTRLLAREGWTVAGLGTAMGFVAIPWLEGTPMRTSDLNAEAIRHIGRYVAAARGTELSASELLEDFERLTDMLYWNTREALGEAAAQRAREWSRHASRLIANQPMSSYGDGRLAPHEWVRTSSGRLIKTDCFGHDSDHTIVGRQSWLWDLAGAMCEWGLDDKPAALMLEAAGVDPRLHELLTFHRMAYAAFRIGLCDVCCGDPVERARLDRASSRYRERLRRELDGIHPMPTK